MEGILATIGYMLIASTTGLFIWKTFNPDDHFLDSPFPMFGGALWPLVIPGLIPVGFYLLAKKVRLPSIYMLRRKSAAQRVEEYSQAPTKVLAQIVAAKILADPQGLRRFSEIWYSSDKKLKVCWDSHYKTLRSVDINNKKITLPDTSSKIVEEALKKAFKINEEKVLADKKAAQQLAALEALESLLEVAPTDGVSLTPEKN